MMLTQAHAQGAQAAAGHIGGIGVQHLSHQIGILTQLRPAARVRHRSADHGVGMADQVFGTCLNRNIDAKIQRFEQDPRRPGVIDHDNRFRGDLTHGGDNRWHIMHFHGDGARRFKEHHAGLRPNKLGNIGANEGIEPAGGDAEFSENFGTKILAWLIGGIGHQHMVALFDERQDGVGHRGRATGEEGAAGAAFQLAHRFLQREMGQGAATTVEQLAVGPIAGGVLFGLDGVENQR